MIASHEEFSEELMKTEDELGEDEARPTDHSQYTDNVGKKYVPEGFKSVDSFLANMRDDYEKDLDFDRLNRDAAIDDKKFAAGEQWDPIVLQHRKGLPCLVINSVPQFVAQLVGDWRENKNGVKVVPSEDGDTDVASVRSDLIRAIQNASRANRVYDNAFESMVQCGDGAFRISVEYAKNDVFDQDIFIRPIDDALSVVWDRFSIDPTGRDARHVFVDDKLPEKEFNRKWPDQDPSNLSTEYRNSLYTGGWLSDEGVRVTEYWRMIERDRLLTLFADGSIRFVDKDNIESLVEKHGEMIKSRVSPCSYAQMHLVSGHAILSGPYEYQLERVPIVRMTGRVVNVAGRRVRFGLVRFMKDAVRLKNFWRSIAAEQLGYAPKAQWIANEKAVEGREDTIRKAHLSRDPLIVVNDDADIGRDIQRLDPPAPQAALLNEANVNTQDMKDVTGIHDASLGIKSNETSGRAIQARQREGDIASLVYYDNGNAAIVEAGDIVNQLISQVYDGTRTVRTIGEDEAVKFYRINDPNNPDSPDLSVGKYDIASTSGTSYTTRRIEAAQAMMEAIQVWPQLIQVAGDIIAKSQDWPGADKLAERLKKTIPQQFLEEGEEGGAPMLSPEEIQQMQMEMQTLAQENQQLKADKSIEAEQLEINRYKAETDRIKALSDHEVDANQMEMDAIAKILDTDTKVKISELQAETARQKSPPQTAQSKKD